MVRKVILKYNNLPIQAKASFWFLICSFLQRGISFITTPVFTRILTTEEYGQYSVFISLMSIISPIVTLSLYAGVYAQGLIKFEEDRKSFSSSLQGLCLTLISCWCVFYLFTRTGWNHFFSLTTIQMLSMFALIWLEASYRFWSMDQRVDFKYKKLVIITLLVAVLQPLFGIILVVNSTQKVTARVLGMVVVQFIFWGWTFWAQMRKGKTFFSKKYWIYVLRFNIPLLPHYLSMTVLAGADRIMISQMAGDDKAGIYSLAYSLAQIMTMFNQALMQTIEPWIYHKLKTKRANDISKVAYPTFIFIAFVNIALIMFAPEAIAIFAPEEYREAIWIIPSVALSVYFMYAYSFFSAFEFYYEKTKLIAGATISGAALNIVLNYIFIGKFGYVAAGYTTLFGYMLFAALHYYFMNQICKKYINGLIPYNFKILIMITVITLLVGFLFLVLYNYTLIRYAVILVIGVITFCFRRKILDAARMFTEIRNQTR